MTMAQTNVSGAVLWNGPTCQTCRQQYVGFHDCPGELWYLRKRLAELEAQQPIGLDKQRVDPCGICPCQPSRGGSGICNCTRGSARITC